MILFTAGIIMYDHIHSMVDQDQMKPVILQKINVYAEIPKIMSSEGRYQANVE